MDELDDLDRQFIAGLAYVHENAHRFLDKEEKIFSALERQACEGDCDFDSDFIESVTKRKDRENLRAWAKFKGFPQEKCKKLYLSKLKQTFPEFDAETAIASFPIVTDMYRRKVFERNRDGIFSERIEPSSVKKERKKGRPGVDGRVMLKKLRSRQNWNDEEEGHISREDIALINRETKQSIRIASMQFENLDEIEEDEEELDGEFFSPERSQFETYDPPPPPPVTASMHEQFVREAKEKEMAIKRLREDFHPHRSFSDNKPRHFERERIQRASSEQPTKSMLQQKYFPQVTQKKQMRNTEDESAESNLKATKDSFNANDYKVVYDQVRRFYQKHNPEMLENSLDRYVTWALRKGVDRLDKKLRKRYGEGLPPPLNSHLIQDLDTIRTKKTKDTERGVREQREVKYRSKHSKKSTKRSQEDEDAFFSNEFLKREVRKRHDSKEDEDSIVRSREFKKRLTLFLLEHEPSKIEELLVIMIKYGEQNGVIKLNALLLKTYDQNIEIGDLIDHFRMKQLEKDRNKRRTVGRSFRVSRKRETKQKMSKTDAKMLALFFAKHDNGQVDSDQIEQVKRWASMNGMGSLNRALKKRYKQDLDEFIFLFEKLKEEIIEFYTLVDSSKLKGLDKIMKWVTVNGRDKLNQELQKRYNIDLDSPTSAMEELKAKYNDF